MSLMLIYHTVILNNNGRWLKHCKQYLPYKTEHKVNVHIERYIIWLCVKGNCVNTRISFHLIHSNKDDCDRTVAKQLDSIQMMTMRTLLIDNTFDCEWTTVVPNEIKCRQAFFLIHLDMLLISPGSVEINYSKQHYMSSLKQLLNV